MACSPGHFYLFCSTKQLRSRKYFCSFKNTYRSFIKKPNSDALYPLFSIWLLIHCLQYYHRLQQSKCLFTLEKHTKYQTKFLSVYTVSATSVYKCFCRWYGQKQWQACCMEMRILAFHMFSAVVIPRACNYTRSTKTEKGDISISKAIKLYWRRAILRAPKDCRR